MWIDRYPCSASGLLDLLKSAMKVRAGFEVNGDIGGTNIRKLLDITLRLNNHQMDIERGIRHAAQGLNHQWTKGYIRDKASIHDINMQEVGPGIEGFHHLF